MRPCRRCRNEYVTECIYVPCKHPHDAVPFDPEVTHWGLDETTPDMSCLWCLHGEARNLQFRRRNEMIFSTIDFSCKSLAGRTLLTAAGKAEGNRIIDRFLAELRRSSQMSASATVRDMVLMAESWPRQ